MATPHSLPPTPSSRTVAKLPFSPSSNNAPRLPGINTSLPASSGRPSRGNSPVATPTSKQVHTRSGSLMSSRSRATVNASHHANEVPIIPSMVLPIHQPRPTSVGTHVGGVLPSASFFNPSRPHYPPLSVTPPTARPSTAGSYSSARGSVDVMRLSQIASSPSQQKEDRISEASDSVDHSVEDVKLSPSLSTNKFSREPLLPITNPHKSGSTALPNIVTNTSSPYGRSDSNVSAGARMRGSFEKLFKKGFNFERSPTTPVNAGPSSGFSPIQARSGNTSPITFELNVGGMGGMNADRSPTSPGHQKHNLSPLQGSTMSLAQASFMATAPAHMNPPLCATPVLNPKTGKPIRNYQLHPSRNRFFLGGRVLTGGDSPWAFIGSFTLLVIVAGVYFGTTCVWWWTNESPAVAAVGAYMCLLTISSMLATAFRDPGILPRNLDPDPPYPATSSSEGSLRVPLPRDLKVRAGIVRTKYCPTCMTYRPPRSSHCKMCDNCVDGCDHHCQWVNNCIGRRNYTLFFTFLFSTVMTLILMICTTAIHLFLLTSKFHMSFHSAISTPQGIGSSVTFIVSILVIWPLLALLSYHLRLLLLNVTTIEQIRNQAHKSLVPGPAPPNPFSHGNWRRNVVYMLCRPTGYSWIDFSAVAAEDKRQVNPGLLPHEDPWPEDVEHGAGRGKGE
ncbi:DHHC palmitoyltransferase-domain-containing protein [Epithele typhae]|uniref:DHHC palmitoyltransferase-domain-containing protein n=1 Tax=Epithele typhae TaxID=378194 RepID=UPI0020080236|nr:DHHC palmitoyltransferase-domain-containing protein [Epithele typhae]KAH9945871.1 DHHC palmitoyltransferase-domain-containing protein [Epithele typhae]